MRGLQISGISLMTVSGLNMVIVKSIGLWIDVVLLMVGFLLLLGSYRLWTGGTHPPRSASSYRSLSPTYRR